ncbi:MAG TPA: universal stress protein [Mycobacteriales bacterium]|nr:universal stress protein [Mycobacteriales bacterium]
MTTDRTGTVVGVDRTPAAAAALRWALEEAVRSGDAVTAACAWSDPFTAGYPVGEVLVASIEQARAAALATAEGVVKEVVPQVPGADGLDVRATALPGGPQVALTDASRTAALVVVGSRGHGALSRAVLGSVSSALVHHAHCPVVVVPEPRTPTLAEPRVVVGVDHSAPSLRALAWAAAHAARRGAVLVPVLVREPVWVSEAGPTAPTASLASLEENERAALRAAVPAGTDVVVEPQVVPGHASGALLDLVAPQDVLVVGTRGRGGFAGLLLGSTSSSVAAHAVCPVVVVR